jgi:hypothetical protein
VSTLFTEEGGHQGQLDSERLKNGSLNPTLNTIRLHVQGSMSASLVEDEIRDEKRTDHTLRLAARVVRPNCSWSNGRLEMVGKDWRRRSSKPSE